MAILKDVVAAVQRHDLLSARDRALVAVSGGPDSVALLHLLCELREEWHLHLEVAHLQHGIRGEEAKEDGRFVADLAERLGIPFHLKEVDVPRIKASAGKGNLEALGRAERYRFFAEVARERKLDKVATAHTLEDQAETVLMWMLRGAGMKGLGGMAPLQKMHVTGTDSSDSITIIRPLLEISKAEILDYLAENEFAYRLDRTNRDTALLRNWIRRELLPALQRRAGGDFPARLSREAELLRDEDRYLDQLASRRLAEFHREGGLDRSALLREATPMQRRILRLWIAEPRGHLRGLDFAHIDALLRLIEHGPPQGRLSIPGGWELAREYDTLRLGRRTRGSERVCYSYEFHPGTMLRIPEAGYELRSETVQSPLKRLPASAMEAVFDAALLSAPLTVRNFRAGDRFQPLGMGGHRKVKELFIERKIPLSIRATLPILVMGAEILWIPGHARSELARVSETTESVLRVTATRFTP
jgi:tRNA(Ile)-lysidine synthase